MNRTLSFLCLLLVWHMPGVGADLFAQSGGKKLLHAALKSRSGQIKTKFSDDVPKISAYWQGETLNAGDKVRAVWIAENVGYAGHRDTQITQGAMVAYKPNDQGVFSLARPVGGWPIGEYRVEIYVGDTLAEKLKFTIESGPKIELH